MGFDDSALFMTRKMAMLNASMEPTTNLLHGGGGGRSGGGSMVGAEVRAWVGVGRWSGDEGARAGS